jgi:hypothetical protein
MIKATRGGWLIDRDYRHWLAAAKKKTGPKKFGRVINDNHARGARHKSTFSPPIQGDRLPDAQRGRSAG